MRCSDASARVWPRSIRASKKRRLLSLHPAAGAHFPFFVIDLLMGLTPIKPLTYCWVSQVGMLAGTLVYVNAGTQLARLDSLSGILSPALLGSFALFGVFPLLATWSSGSRRDGSMPAGRESAVSIAIWW